MKYDGITCGLAIERPAAAVVVIRLTGWDTGEFGDAPMREVAKDFAADRPLALFVVRLTARFVQRFADLGEIMRIYTDAPAFDAALRAATEDRGRTPTQETGV